MFSDAMILVVGADPQDREIILQALGETCHVVAAQKTEDALAHVSDRVQLVISESVSASYDGAELVRRWKLVRSATPFLMLINEHDVDGAVNAMKNGADDCIQKPISADSLRSLAMQLMSGSADRPVNGSDMSSGRRRSNIDIPPDTSLEDLERAAVEQALVQHHGNRTHAARTLGISVRTLQRKLKAWGMPIVSFPSASPSTVNFLRSAPSFRAHVH